VYRPRYSFEPEEIEMTQSASAQAQRAEELAAYYCQRNPAAARWAAGYGAIQHTVETQARVYEMAWQLEARGERGDGVALFDLLHAADRICSAAMWLVVHQTYAQNVYLDGRQLEASDFKPNPEGHTGGALNMVPAYVGYMTVNAITGLTRAWAMGQGHTVAAIDSVNILLDNMTPAHQARYSLSDQGLTSYVRDFYSYRLNEQGKIDSPLGSHVGVNTAGGLVEGGYLGFTELQWVHMPLPGERLVVFLSDGAFEEQRGSDWAPRWWRAHDSGIVTPIMIDNGRRIDQRTTFSQQGGKEWLQRHLELNSFDPFAFDGRDPAAFAWAIFEQETRLEAAAKAVADRGDSLPIQFPYGIAVSPKGAGFYGEGTNLAHNLPLQTNPSRDVLAAQRFNEGARRLWVPLGELRPAISAFQHHDGARRPRERDHALATRDVRLRNVPAPAYRPVADNRRDPTTWQSISPMWAVDEMYLATVKANPHLRPRIGNPDEMRSNQMIKTLEALKFRVTDPEPGVPEAVDGAVITALNEEAVSSAAFANKGGINIIITYEAFGGKMFGGLRQEIIWVDHAQAAGKKTGWLSVPLVLTSHTWENGKNEHSHQDPSMAESLLGEVSNISRVVFPADWNTAAAVMHALYQTQGQYWTLVVPKQPLPDLFTGDEAQRLMADGAIRLDWVGHNSAEPEVILTALGAYQLAEVLRASWRLADREVPHSVVYMLEPGRFRAPRNEREQAHCASPEVVAALYPDSVEARVFVSHTRPEPLLGVLAPLWTGRRTRGLGFINHGGTLNIEGLLYVNGCTWAHCVAEVAKVLDLDREKLLSADELAAVDRKRSPHGIIIPERPLPPSLPREESYRQLTRRILHAARASGDGAPAEARTKT
jgi:phosphoketolase